MTIVWALFVVSSEPQAETLPHQRSWAERTAREHGWHLTRVMEGVASGVAGPRRLVRDLLYDVRAESEELRPKYVLMIRLDRLGRGSIVEAQVLLRELLALGVRVFTRDAGEIRLDSAMDELIAAVQLAVARHENDVRSDKMRAIHRRRREAGQIVSNNSPYGLMLNADRQFVADPEYKEVIAEAFRQRIAGVSCRLISLWLLEHAPPHRYKNGRSHVVPWQNNRVWYLLRQRSYIGPIVSEATFLRAQRVVYTVGTQRGPRVRREFVLNGAMRCTCGYALSGVAFHNRDRTIRIRHYGCRATRNHSSEPIYHLAETLEESFVRFLGRISENPEKYLKSRRFGVKARSQTALEKDIARYHSALDSISRQRTRVWKMNERGSLDTDAVEERLDSLVVQKAKIEGRLVPLLQERTLLASAIQEDEGAIELLRTAHGRWANLEYAERKELARSVAVVFGGLRVSRGGAILIGSTTRDRRLRKYRAAAP